METTTGRGPERQRDCSHDSTRADGWLDDHCLRCGVSGYFKDGRSINVLGRKTKRHPSGKTLIWPDEPAPPTPQEESREGTRADVAALFLDGDSCEYGCEGPCENLDHWKDRASYLHGVCENQFERAEKAEAALARASSPSVAGRVESDEDHWGNWEIRARHYEQAHARLADFAWDVAENCSDLGTVEQARRIIDGLPLSARAASPSSDTPTRVEAFIEKLRTVARECGYALGVHGSLARDLDLIAVPWREWAVPEEDLIQLLCAATSMTLRTAESSGIPNYENPEQRPHGRSAWAFDGIPVLAYLDLSVFPPSARASASSSQQEAAQGVGGEES